MNNFSNKSKAATMTMCILYGIFGGHRFYVGKIGTGFLYLFTGGLFCIGWIIDIIKIATDKFADKDGKKIVPAAVLKAAGIKPDPNANTHIIVAIVAFIAFGAIGNRKDSNNNSTETQAEVASTQAEQVEQEQQEQPQEQPQENVTEETEQKETLQDKLDNFKENVERRKEEAQKEIKEERKQKREDMPVLNVGETWVVDDEWELTIDSVYETKERNQFSDKNPAAVYIIDYTYKNLNYVSRYDVGKEGLYFNLILESTMVDAGGNTMTSYPAGDLISNSPKVAPIGSTCKAKEAVCVDMPGDFTIVLGKNDSNGNKQTVKFICTP